MLNKVFLQGRLCENPELRHTQSGTAVCSFTLAVERNFKNQGADRETDFINCVAWKSVAEFVVRYFTRGSMAIVDGRLQVREWTDKDGNKRRNYEVIADNVYFGERKREEQNDYTRQVWPDKPNPSIGEQPVQFDEIDGDGRLPF